MVAKVAVSPPASCDLCTGYRPNRCAQWRLDEDVPTWDLLTAQTVILNVHKTTSDATPSAESTTSLRDLTGFLDTGRA